MGKGGAAFTQPQRLSDGSVCQCIQHMEPGTEELSLSLVT